MQTFRDKVVVVTGAASGIGRALAERFAAEGTKLVLADVDARALAETADALRTERVTVIAVTTDVSRASDVDALADRAFRELGRVDILCNNAGVTRHTGQAVWELSANDWQWLVGVNLMGVIHGIRAFVPRMLAAGGDGHVVNTASYAGLIVGTGAYGVAKQAVVGLSESLLLDLERHGGRIGVTCLCPGLVATNIVDSEQHRPAELRDERPDDPRHVAYRQEIAEKTKLRGVDPARIAELTLQAIRDNAFYVLSDGAERTDGPIRARMTSILERSRPQAPPRPR